MRVHAHTCTHFAHNFNVCPDILAGFTIRYFCFHLACLLSHSDYESSVKGMKKYLDPVSERWVFVCLFLSFVVNMGYTDYLLIFCIVANYWMD